MTGRLRQGSVVERQRADFQTIAAGLEAYKQDFGDYPRNIELPKWNTRDGAAPAPIHLTLASALLGPGPAVTQEINGNANNARGNISVAGGKVWGPYISADTFKVTFIPSGVSGSGQPVLLDRWGQVIQYFPRYGPANNRTNDSTYSTNPSVQAGPLFGYSQPKSVDGATGQNAIWDWRDGATFFSASESGIAWNAANPVTGKLDYAKPWPNPTQTMGSDFRPELAIQWMLGEPDSGGNFNNEILAGERLSYDGPYILISAGPGGPERSNGGFCSMVDPLNYDNPLPSNKLQQAFIDSGNIYNFDRP
jgi:hypothetical protein